MKISKPNASEYAGYYKSYINLVESQHIDEILEANTKDLKAFIKSNSDRLDFRYQKDRWSIKECIIHILDAELVFVSRALRLARGDHQSLPGFDQDAFISNNNFEHYKDQELINLLDAQRRLTLTIINNLVELDLKKRGRAAGYSVSVRSLLYILTGHAIHHYRILEERYS